jgi:hypothetical protein
MDNPAVKPYCKFLYLPYVLYVCFYLVSFITGNYTIQKYHGSVAGGRGVGGTSGAPAQAVESKERQNT